MVRGAQPGVLVRRGHARTFRARSRGRARPGGPRVARAARTRSSGTLPARIGSRWPTRRYARRWLGGRDPGRRLERRRGGGDDARRRVARRARGGGRPAPRREGRRYRRAARHSASAGSRLSSASRDGGHPRRLEGGAREPRLDERHARRAPSYGTNAARALAGEGDLRLPRGGAVGSTFGGPEASAASDERP